MALTTAATVGLPGAVAERDLPPIEIDALLQRRHGSQSARRARRVSGQRTDCSKSQRQIAQRGAS